MKRLIPIIVLVVGCVVPGAHAMKKSKSESSFSAAKVLGALGVGAAGAGYAYYKYDPAGAQQKYTEAKQKLGEARDYVVNYVKTADNRTLGYGLLGTAAATYLAYKLFYQGSEPELAVESPDADAFLKKLGSKQPVARTTVAPKAQAEQSPEFEAWLREAGALLWQVFSSIKDENQRRQAIKPLLKIVAKDPHELLRDQKFVDRLSKQQRFVLLQIFVAYSMDRVVKSAQALHEALRDDQDGVKVMLAQALETTDAEHHVAPLLNLLEMFVEDKVITGKQLQFVEGELETIRGFAEIQTNYCEIYGLDEMLATKLQQDAAAQPSK